MGSKISLNKAYEEYLEMKKTDPQRAANYICIHIYELAKVFVKKWSYRPYCEQTMDSICNTATYRFYRALKNYDPEKASFVTYAYASLRSIVNQVIHSVGHSQHMPHKKGYKVSTNVDATLEAIPAESDNIAIHVADIIDKIPNLNPKHKIIFLVKYREFFPKSYKKDPKPLSNDKVAKIVGASYTTVSNALQNVSLLVKNYIETHGLSDGDLGTPDQPH